MQKLIDSISTNGINHNYAPSGLDKHTLSPKDNNKTEITTKSISDKAEKDSPSSSQELLSSSITASTKALQEVLTELKEELSIHNRHMEHSKDAKTQTSKRVTVQLNTSPSAPITPPPHSSDANSIPPLSAYDETHTFFSFLDTTVEHGGNTSAENIKQQAQTSLSEGSAAMSAETMNEINNNNQNNAESINIHRSSPTSQNVIHITPSIHREYNDFTTSTPSVSLDDDSLSFKDNSSSYSFAQQEHEQSTQSGAFTQGIATAVSLLPYTPSSHSDSSPNQNVHTEPEIGFSAATLVHFTPRSGHTLGKDNNATTETDDSVNGIFTSVTVESLPTAAENKEEG